MNFISLFEVVIQLGAILAVILLFFHKLNPFAKQERAAEAEHMAAVVQGGACGDSFRGDRGCRWMTGWMHIFTIMLWLPSL